MKMGKFIRNPMRTAAAVAGVLLLLLALLADALLIPATPAYAVTETFTTSGTFTWTAPAGVTSVTVEVWGSGGRGGSISGGSREVSGGGGGGGAYSIKANIAVTPGNSYTYVVGAGATTSAAGGDSYFLNQTTVLAKGGNSVAANSATGATGGASGSGYGDTKYSGGNGANGRNQNNRGGGGGSSAGTASDGTNATNQNGATAPTGGGNGGNARSGSSGNGTGGSVPGGGGGGAYRNSGSGSYTGGSGANGKVVITYKYNTTTTVDSSLNPSTYGQTVTFTATVTPSAATGSVEFFDGATSLGTSALSSGTATLDVNWLDISGSPHSITASYLGNTDYTASTSSPISQIVTKTDTSTSLVSSLDPSKYGQTVTFTATINVSAATGTIEFYDGATLFGSNSSLVNGVGALAVSTLSVSDSPHSITAYYLGNDNCSASTSNTVSQIVNKTDTSTAVASSANPSGYGQSVTFTATVNNSEAAGTVQFNIDGAPFGSLVTVSGGTATSDAISSLSIGNHPVTADYSGDANCGANSGTLAGGQTVACITTYTYDTAGTYQWTAPAGGSSVTVEVWGGGGSGGMRSSRNRGGGGGGGGAYSIKTDIAVTPGDNYTIVIGAGSSSGASPGGDSYFIDTSTVLAKGGGSVADNSNTGASGGQASAGAGDTLYSGGNGANGVSGAYGGGGGSSAGTAADGNNGSGSTGGTAPTDGGNGGNGGTPPGQDGYPGSAPGGGGGGAYRGLSGTYYGGNGADGKVIITYKYDTTTTVNSSLNPSTYGQTVTFTATVTPSAATDNVEFFDGSTSLGTSSLSSGTATLDVNWLDVPGSPHSITAKYLGDSCYAPSTSPAISQTILSPITIEITAPTDISSWDLDPTLGENTNSGTLSVDVTPYSTSWSVTAKDVDTINTNGSMTQWYSGNSSYGMAKLANPMRVQGPDAEVTLPNSAGVDIATGTGDYPAIDITFKQIITWDDDPDTYQIVVTFIGIVN